MTVTALMGVSTQALFAAYRQVHTIGNNIANANTEGYSRQKAVQTPSLTMRTEAGYVGTGVTVSSIQRASNQFLTDKAATLKSVAAADQTGRNLLAQLEQVFGSGDAGLGNAATQVFGAFADLSVNPSDLSARQAVLGRLEEFASLSRANGAQVQAMQDNVRSDITGAVSEVNTMAKQVAALNRQIQAASAQGLSPNDLLDKRDVLVSQMADQVDLQTYTTDQGGMAVFVAGGQPLVLDGESNELVVQRDQLDPSRTAVSISIQGELTLLAGQNIDGGRIGGLLHFQNDDLLSARNRLGQLVTAVAVQLNDQQSYGIDLYGNAGSPIFDIPAPQALAASTNARDATGNAVSSMQLEVADPAALKGSDYELRADPANAGSFILTRQSDGLVRTGVVSGDVVDGLRITSGATAPSANERFLLRAVANVPASLTMALRDPKGLAAAGPVVASLGAANTGTVTVSAVDIVAQPTSAYSALTVRFSDNTGSYDLLDSNGSPVASGVFQAGQPLEIDGVAVSLAGVPRQGDEVFLKPITYYASHNGNALSVANLGQKLLIDGQQVGEAYASLFSDVGVRAQSTAIAADNSGAAATRAAEALSSETGVNLDEEAARLIQYQQSYQAAAKVLQSAQTMIDTILGLTR